MRWSTSSRMEKIRAYTKRTNTYIPRQFACVRTNTYAYSATKNDDENRSAAVSCGVNGIQQRATLGRLFEDCGCSGFRQARCHGGIKAASQNHNRRCDPAPSQIFQEFCAVYVRHMDIQQQAVCSCPGGLLQEFRCGTKPPNAEVHSLEQPACRFTHGVIIVNDVDDFL